MSNEHMGLGRVNTGRPQTLWFSLRRICNLDCAYCYAENGNEGELLELRDYTSILLQAKQMGVDTIGIPGAGEPFINGCIQTTVQNIYLATMLGMLTTVFTTAEFITEDIADWLWNFKVELMIKFNCKDPEMQDRFVSNPCGRTIHGYGQKRNEVLEMLMAKGWNDRVQSERAVGKPSRLSLVTSIMTSQDGPTNYDMMAEYLRFCRENNLTVDCDSILTKGRGAGCALCIDDLRMKRKLEELQQIDREEFGREWEIGSGYIGVACDRYMHHLYVDQFGEIHPCIGAMEVKLGNIRDTMLTEAWEHPAMQIIRARKYGGVCGTNCKNFELGLCCSCLGRRGKDLNTKNLLAKGYVDTVGCWNNRPIHE